MPGVQAALPRGRRAARRRHPVPRAHRAAPGGVLPHVQRPPRRGRPDRHLLRPAAEVDRDASRTGCAAASSGASSPTSSRRSSRPASPSSARRPRPSTSAGIPDEVLAFIANNIIDNVRELEGALIRVAAYSSLVFPARRALADGLRLHLTYFVPTRDETTERDVDPMRVVLMDGRWYLEGWCHRAEAVRLFRLDRVEAVKVLEIASEVPAEATERDLDLGLFVPSPATSRWCSSSTRRRTGSPTTTRSSPSRTCPTAAAGHVARCGHPLAAHAGAAPGRGSPGPRARELRQAVHDRASAALAAYA